MKALFSRNSDDWATPDFVYNYLNNIYNFDFDPCPLYALDNGYNGLIETWGNSNYVNPPYSNIKEFVDKGILESELGKKVVFLIPARTDTQNFLKLYEYGCNFTFIVGRLKFNDAGSAPFPSVIIELIGNGINTIDYIKRDDMR